MKTKKCYKCKLDKPIEDYSKNSSRKDKLSSQCKKCHKVMRREHYEKNKQNTVKRVFYRRKNLVEWMQQLKKSPCIDCSGSFPPYAMDFDHKSNKKFCISVGAQLGYSKSRILEEIEKCDLVCSNCHRIRTFMRV